MIDLTKVKPNDIFYTIGEIWDDELDVNTGRISICVKNVEPWGDSDREGVLAHGQCWYPADQLTTEKPPDDEYTNFGEEYLKYLNRKDIT